MKKYFLLIAFITCILVSCKPDLEKPTVVSSPISQIAETSAVAGGEVISDGGTEVKSRGVCWSVDSNPTIENDKTIDGEGVGSFQSNLSDLSQNTTYYVRAYATNSEGTSYGEEVSFTTLEIVDDEDTDDEDNSDEDDTDDSDEEDEIVVELAVVTTLSVSEITETSAVVGCEVTYDGGAEVTSRGICWSVDSNPTIENEKTVEGEGVGSFQSVLSGLSQNTTYYVRAYATNSKGTAYGEEVTFKTLEEIIDDGTSINGYEYVDLGLQSGLKWATCNIGAADPYESGDYFAWGEINTKAEFTEMNCTSYGLNMQDIAGDPQYDAARANWGATWKVPSKKDFEELMNECTWEWMVINGKGCKKVTGPNGNYIILPITGYQYGTSFYMEDFGYYWASTPISTYEQFSYDFFFDEEYNLSMGFDERCYGQAIRPVSE